MRSPKGIKSPAVSSAHVIHGATRVVRGRRTEIHLRPGRPTSRTSLLRLSHVCSTADDVEMSAVQYKQFMITLVSDESAWVKDALMNSLVNLTHTSVIDTKMNKKLTRTALCFLPVGAFLSSRPVGMSRTHPAQVRCGMYFDVIGRKP